jgi:hypothetical protein
MTTDALRTALMMTATEGRDLAPTMLAPAEAVEVLHTRGLWPWAPGDDASPRWWCDRCDGTGLDPRVRLYRKPCAERCDWGTAAHPPTLADLVAVASLGVDTLRRAEGLALQLVGRSPRIVWRVMTREALTEWVASGAGRPVAEAPQTIPQAACVAAVRGGWDGVTPWWLHEAQAVAAAWSAVRDIVALGVTPVALDGDRITLAVESPA